MQQDIGALIDSKVRTIQDYPQKGIQFKDICPLLKDQEALNQLTDYFVSQINFDFDYIVGIESRGFLFGILLANRLNKPFVPIRKKNKLPGEKFTQEYGLEYGKDCIEIQADALSPGAKVIIVDDLIATGGSAKAAEQLITKAGGETAGYLFVIELVDLQGRKQFNPEIPVIVALKV